MLQYLDGGNNRRESQHQHQLQHQHQRQDIIGASSSVGEHLPISSKWSVKIPMAAPKQIQIPTRTNTSMHSNTNTHGSARRSHRIPPLLTEQALNFFCYFQQELLHAAILSLNPDQTSGSKFQPYLSLSVLIDQKFTSKSLPNFSFKISTKLLPTRSSSSTSATLTMVDHCTLG